ncbi:aldehyde dehydrogenase family protein [Pseudonocardia acidicola]|uniref:Aldehyde dehydrogenase family protein n=1 Tax=Pseudonocardia acidicola TaxID=2724939 RepID=A0ABX1S8M8_9PSEU|nr:aldehyde dehydrogenase family protein [Pseudonocardia acidicola]
MSAGGKAFTGALGVRDDDPVAAEEIFGSVVVVQTRDFVDEVVTRANRSNHGLTVRVRTKDLAEAHTVWAERAAGTVRGNTCGDVSTAAPRAG